MSYSGTVTCSHCYNRGHNKRGCPEFKQFVKNNPDSWAAQRAIRNAENAKKRRCSYCAKIGHNRRGCSDLKQAVIVESSDSRIYRRNFLKYIKELGLTPGALVVKNNVREYANGGYQTFDRRVYQLVDIAWDHVRHEAKTDEYVNPEVFVFAPVARLMQRGRGSRTTEGYSNHPTANLSTDLKDLDKRSCYMAEWELASPSTSSCAPPSDFVNDISHIEENYKEKTSPDYYDNRYNG